jgi:hypothetical protein
LDQIGVPTGDHDTVIALLTQVILAHNVTATWTAGVEFKNSEDLENIRSPENSANAEMLRVEDSPIFKSLAGIDCEKLIPRIVSTCLGWEATSISRNFNLLQQSFLFRDEIFFTYFANRELLLLVRNAVPEFRSVPSEIVRQIGNLLPYSVRGGLNFGAESHDSGKWMSREWYLHVALDPESKKFSYYERKEGSNWSYEGGYKIISEGTWEVISGPRKSLLDSFPGPQKFGYRGDRYDEERRKEDKGGVGYKDSKDEEEVVLLVLRETDCVYASRNDTGKDFEPTENPGM